MNINFFYNKFWNHGPARNFWKLDRVPAFRRCPVAEALLPGGTLDVLDIQRKMLMHLTTWQQKGTLSTYGQSLEMRKIPLYQDAVFNAVYMIGTLGEIPDQPVR